MRIKFEKGMTPERIGQAFAKFVRDNALVIGSVNIYVQTYDEQMKPKKNDGGYFICRGNERFKSEYTEDVADIRRSRLKVANE